MGKRLEFLFAGEQPDLTFVEVEDGHGHSIRVGEWIKRDEFSVLVLDENAEIARLRADLAEARVREARIDAVILVPTEDTYDEAKAREPRAWHGTWDDGYEFAMAKIVAAWDGGG